MKLSEFDYDLPSGAIAQSPLPERDQSRLLVLDRRRGRIRHHVFRDLPDLLKPGDLLVVNRSRVFPARLQGRRRGGGSAEVLLLRDQGERGWEALVRPGRRLRPGDEVAVDGGLVVRIETERLPPDGRRLVSLHPRPADVFRELERLGHTPLPLYVRRPDGPADRERYQTVYAREPGSVAAPTAGLHFTPSLRRRLAETGVAWAEIILHVGPATFQPVRAMEVEKHRLEAEPFCIPAAAAAAVRQARAAGGRVLAVGTTSARALETAARDDGSVAAGDGETDLVIVPGFRFRVVDALLTNFHLPRSSPLLLVSAFGGRQRILSAYGQAARAGYRFYSYGDAMLVG